MRTALLFLRQGEVRWLETLIDMIEQGYFARRMLRLPGYARGLETVRWVRQEVAGSRNNEGREDRVGQEVGEVNRGVSPGV